jgi:hypothetical protein
MALTGTAGQLVNVAAEVFTVTDQLPFLFPCIPHWIDAVLLPFAGVVSGSGDENVIVAGVMVGPVMVPVAGSAVRTNTRSTDISRNTSPEFIMSPKL